MWSTVIAAFDALFRLIFWSPLETTVEERRLTHSVLCRALGLNEDEGGPVCSHDEAVELSSTGRRAAGGGQQKIGARGSARGR